MQMVMGATLRPFIGGLRASPMRERPTQSASLCLSVPLPLHPCISEWFLSRRRRNTLLRRQLKKSERSKQFSLMPPRSVALRSPPTKIAFAFIFFSFPSSSANQRARSLRASSPSKPPSPSFPSWRPPSRPRWGSRSRDPVWALPSLPRSPGSAARARPARVFGRPSPSSSLRFGSWLRRRPLA